MSLAEIAALSTSARTSSEISPYLEQFAASRLGSCLLSAPYSSIAEYAGTMLISNLLQAATLELILITHILVLFPIFHVAMYCLLKTALSGGHCCELLSTSVGTDRKHR